MSKKKRELIDIILDNVNPEDWPEGFPFAAQDKDCTVHYCSIKPIIYPNDEEFRIALTGKYKRLSKKLELARYWNKTIVHRDEFMKRWNERNTPVEVKTPQQLALEKFGTDWHNNEGVQPVDDNVLIDAIVHSGAMMEKYTWPTLGLFKIKKWRIHSDDKESQAELAANKLACDDGPMPSVPVSKSPLETQIGGDHYTKLAIQPMQYSMENKLDPLQHAAIKYVTRFRDKNGIEDLEKARHCIDMLIAFERDK